MNNANLEILMNFESVDGIRDEMFKLHHMSIQCLLSSMHQWDSWGVILLIQKAKLIRGLKIRKSE